METVFEILIKQIVTIVKVGNQKRLKKAKRIYIIFIQWAPLTFTFNLLTPVKSISEY